MTYEQAFADDDAAPVAPVVPANFQKIGNRIVPDNAPALIVNALRAVEDAKAREAAELEAKTAQSIADARAFVIERFAEKFGVTLNSDEIEVETGSDGRAIRADFQVDGLRFSINSFLGNVPFYVNGGSVYDLEQLGNQLGWVKFDSYFAQLMDSQGEGCQ